MKIKKITKIFVAVAILILLTRSCIKKDIPDYEKKQPTKIQELSNAITHLKEFKTVSINGVDYIQSRGEIGKFGGEFKSSSIGEGPKTFSPWNSKDATSSEFGDLMFDGLVTTDAYTGKVIPKLAKKITINPNNTEYLVELRHGLKWSDGKPITADDVVFTWNNIVIAGYGNTSMLDTILINGTPPIVKKINDYTILFKTPKPFAPFERQLSLAIAPKHILEPIVNKGKEVFNSFWGVTTNPNDFVTSGMFRLEQYIPAQRVVFKRNTNYYMIDKKNQKLPYLNKYIVYIVGDLNNEVLKFEANEIDVLNIRGSDASRFKEMEKNSNYHVYNLGPGTGTNFLAINLNNRKSPNGKYHVEPKKQKWFNNVSFRKAIDYAIDREGLVMNVLSGVGSPLFTAETLSSIYLNEKLKNGHKRNLNYSKELLKESGFIWNKNGTLIDTDGNIVEFTLLTNAGNTEREAVGVMIKQDLEELGMKVNFKPIEFNVLVGKLVDSLDWDAAVIGLTGNTLEPHSGINVWGSYGTMHIFNLRKNRVQDLLPWEKKLDYIFEQGASELNFAKRKKIYNEYQQIVYEQRPFIYLYSPLRIVAVRNKFGNINPTTIGGFAHNLEEIYIK